MRKSRLLMIGLLIAGVGGFYAAPAQASTQYLGVTTHKFLKTQRKIVTQGANKKGTVTIPKGTVVQIQAISASNGKTWVGVNVNQLSYNIRKNYHQSVMTKSIPATTKNFKHVTVPKYLGFYATQKTYPDGALRNYKADGNLYKGTKYPKNDTKAKLAHVHVTTNGYLEYDQRRPFKIKGVAGKPTTSVKITKTQKSKNQVVLYTKGAVPKTVGTKVSSKGNYRYRTTIKRLNKFYGTLFYNVKTKNVLNSIEISAGYQIGKQTYFMNESTVYPA